LWLFFVALLEVALFIPAPGHPARRIRGGGRGHVEIYGADGYHTESRPLTLRHRRPEAMADLLWEKKDGVLIGRLVVPGPLSQKDLDSVGHELMGSPKASTGKILLDLQEVEFISTTLLAKLVTLHNECKASKTALKFCSIPPLVMNVIKLARLDTIFEIHSSEQEAMAAF
jgi:anti-anti-sigma factor